VTHSLAPERAPVIQRAGKGAQQLGRVFANRVSCACSPRKRGDELGNGTARGHTHTGLYNVDEARHGGVRCSVVDHPQTHLRSEQRQDQALRGGVGAPRSHAPGGSQGTHDVGCVKQAWGASKMLVYFLNA
jgi:hypothetical protein